VAACDFSKTARDAFYEETLKLGVHEAHIWGAAEVEDRLFTPQYDHLLFAYFGFSLQARRRSTATAVRSRLAIKRQLNSVVGPVRDELHQAVLIRDPTDVDYPYVGNVPEFEDRPRWLYAMARSHEPPDHLAFEVARFFAYASDDATWDAARIYNDLNVPDLAMLDKKDDFKMRAAVYDWWSKNVPPENQGHLEIWRFIPYDRILAVDELGDRYNEGPHLLIARTGGGGIFDDKTVLMFMPSGGRWDRKLITAADTRVSIFPEEFREPAAKGDTAAPSVVSEKRSRPSK
jgi:hypothetical protein